jgi:hypothetical protein
MLAAYTGMTNCSRQTAFVRLTAWIGRMFDGHPEKPLSKMTPREKIYYLWLQMEFHYAIRNRKIIKKKNNYI